jgi:hypothetical protein
VQVLVSRESILLTQNSKRISTNYGIGDDCKLQISKTKVDKLFLNFERRQVNREPSWELKNIGFSMGVP